MENFVVSARKYRPATFASVVGQSHITSTLKNAISRGQLAHAYLFCGPRGVGKTTCARIFAKAINCMSPVGDEACGQCESCRGFDESRSFNIHELDAASNNSVDDIRSLTEQVRIPPQIGRYSVYIIDEVHMLSAQAFNAFLKTLEEPPAHAVFILATTEKHKIIPTILSRCQIFDFNRIRVEDAVGYLQYIAGQEGIAADDESLHLISLKADGGMRDALSMFDKAVSFCGNTLNFKDVARTLNVLDYDTYFRAADTILAGDYPAALTLLDEVLRSGFSGQTFAAGMNAHMRDLLMSRNPQTLPLLEVSGTLLDKYRTQAAKFDDATLIEAISLLTALDGTLRTAASPRLNVELALMKLCGLAQKKKPDGSVTGETAPELPPLVKGGAVRVASPAVQTAAPVVSNGTPASQTVPPAQAPKKEMDVSEAAPVQQTGSIVSVPEGGEGAPAEVSKEAVASQTMPPVEPPKKESRASIHKRPQTISGSSIGDILNTAKSIHDEPVGEGEEQELPVDPDTEMKIIAAKEQFLTALNRKRPRIATAMEDMKIAANAISFTVPTDTLYEDIMRNRSEILSLLAEVAGVEGRIEMSVEIRQGERRLKPIKAEDKLRHLTERNPELVTLIKQLGLDME